MDRSGPQPLAAGCVEQDFDAGLPSQHADRGGEGQGGNIDLPDLRMGAGRRRDQTGYHTEGTCKGATQPDFPGEWSLPNASGSR